MFNKVILVGRLTRDVELKYLPSGTSVATFSLAASRNWKDKNSGESKEETMFIDVDSFGRSAEIANQYLKKGSRVLVEGRLVQDRWQDQQGQNRSKHKVMAENIKFMETKAEAQSGGYGGGDNAPSYGNDSQNNYNQPNNSYQPKSNPQAQVPQKEEQIPEIDIDDDDIPF